MGRPAPTLAAVRLHYVAILAIGVTFEESLYRETQASTQVLGVLAGRYVAARLRSKWAQLVARLQQLQERARGRAERRLREAEARFVLNTVVRAHLLLRHPAWTRLSILQKLPRVDRAGGGGAMSRSPTRPAIRMQACAVPADARRAGTGRQAARPARAHAAASGRAPCGARRAPP